MASHLSQSLGAQLPLIAHALQLLHGFNVHQPVGRGPAVPAVASLGSHQPAKRKEACQAP